MNDLIIEKLMPLPYGGVVFPEMFFMTLPRSDRSLLLSSNGRSMFGDKALLEQLKLPTPPTALLDKLKSKGFGDKVIQSFCPKQAVHLPTFFIIDFTTKCNMNCYYCMRHFEDSGETISIEQLDKILQYLLEYCKKYQVNDIDIQPWGGEPLLALDRIAYMRHFLDEHGIRTNITIQTNGLLLNEANIATLEQCRVGVGVSIDGCREIHDLHRKTIADGFTYSRVAENIKQYERQTGKHLGTISVVSKMSLPYTEASIETLVKEIGVSWLKLNFMHPNSDLFDDASVVSEEDIFLMWEKVIKKFVSLYREGYIATDSNLCDKALNLVGCGGMDICHSYGCTGGYRFVSFSQDGNIYPCELIGVEEYRLGSIDDAEDLPALISRAIPCNSYFAEKTDPKCASCPWMSFCRGGCTAAARFNRKRPGEIDDKECASNRAIYPRLVQILLEEPSLFGMLANGNVRFDEGI